MNKQSQWLFEAPFVLESDRSPNSEYYNDAEWEAIGKDGKCIKPSKALRDRFLEVYVYWDLQVPLRKDLESFQLEVVEAIGRHVAKEEKKKIAPILTKLLINPNNLEEIQKYYFDFKSQAECDFITVRVSLRFKKDTHTDLDWLYIELP